MKMKIVSDSACDILTLDKVPFTVVPLHIIVGEQDFSDDADVDVLEMQNALFLHKGKTSTTCPSPGDWVDAFEDYDVVFCTTITGGLSGSNSSANTAKGIYEGDHPGRKVYVIDSLSTGPEITLLIQMLRDLIVAGLSHEEIYTQIIAYQKTTHLYYSLASLDNLARNGRVNPILAKGIGMLGIRIVGKASDEGTLESTDKVRGDKKAIPCLIKHMANCGYIDGKVIIGHNNNYAGALLLKEAIVESFGFDNTKDKIQVQETRALDSYYAEPHSLLIGFEA